MSIIYIIAESVKINYVLKNIPYRGLFSLGLYFRCKAKALELIPLKFLLQHKSYGE